MNYAGCRNTVETTNMENKPVMSYTAVDLETTGLDAKKDKMIEIGAARVRNGQVTDTYTTLVRPGRILQEAITELTGITDDMLTGAKDSKQAITELLDFLGDDVLLGHCILFDYSFIKRCAVNHGFAYEALAIDTLKIARKYLPDLPSRSLPYLCEHYAIKRRSHRALEDVLATVELYGKLCEEYYDDTEVFIPQQQIYQIKKENPATRQQKENLYQFIKNRGIKVDYDIETLTRNEASRNMDRLILQYGRMPKEKKGFN